MTSTNILIASFYSFLIHAGLFLGFFGYFEQTAKPNKILSSPLSVKMLVEEVTPNTQKKNLRARLVVWAQAANPRALSKTLLAWANDQPQWAWEDELLSLIHI